jgi:hypothetical protein
VNFEELQDEVLFNTFDDSKYRVRAGRALNAGAREVASRTLWGWATVTLSPAAGVVSLGSPPSWSTIKGCWQVDPQGNRLRRLQSAGDFSMPAAQTAWGDDPPDRVGLNPEGQFFVYLDDSGEQWLKVADDVTLVRVDGYRLPAAMVDPGDVSALGTDADEALVSFARAQLYKREDDPEMYAALMADFERELKGFAKRTRPNQSGPKLTPGMWGEGSFGGF